MVGGSKDKLSGILAKKRQLKALQTQLAAVDRELTTARKRQKELETEVRTIESRLHQFTEQKNQDSRDQLELEKTPLQGGRRTQAGPAASGHRDPGAGAAAGRTIRYRCRNDQIPPAARGHLPTGKGRPGSVVAALTDDIGKATSELEAYNQRVMDLKLELTALRSQFENSANTLRRLHEVSTRRRTPPGTTGLRNRPQDPQTRGRPGKPSPLPKTSWPVFTQN